MTTQSELQQNDVIHMKAWLTLNTSSTANYQCVCVCVCVCGHVVN